MSKVRFRTHETLNLTSMCWGISTHKGSIIEYNRDVQYTEVDIMSTPGDIMSTSGRGGETQHSAGSRPLVHPGGYHEYSEGRGCSVHLGIP